MFAECHHILCCMGGGQTNTHSLSLSHIHTYTYRQPNASMDCWSIRYDIRVVSVCVEACQKCRLADTDEITWRADLWAICQTQKRQGQRGMVLDRRRPCVRVSSSAAVNIVHFMSLHGNMSLLSGAETVRPEWKGTHFSPHCRPLDGLTCKYTSAVDQINHCGLISINHF